MIPLLIALHLIELPQPWPTVADRFNFPSREACVVAKDVNREYKRYLQGLLGHYDTNDPRGGELRSVVEQVDSLYWAWDWLYDAQAPEGFVDSRRINALWRLKNIIGEEAYWAGRMPLPVPIHRFHPID